MIFSQLFTVILIILFGATCVVGLGIFFGAPYLPSKKRDVQRMLKHYGLSASDVLLDLGCGDGLVLRRASQFGAQAVGYEINPIFYLIATILSRHDSRVTVRLTNAWLESFPKNTTIVYIFSVQRDGPKLERLMQRQANKLNKQLQLVCYGNPLPHVAVVSKFEAYSFYSFAPLQQPIA